MTFRKCEICNIRSGRVLNQKRQFMAKFPLDEDRCREWVRNTGKEDLAYVPIEKLHVLKFICGKHFRTQDFKKKKSQLKKTAVPSLFLTAEPLSDEILKEFPLHVYSKNVLKQDSPLHETDRSYCIYNLEPSIFDHNSKTERPYSPRLWVAHVIYKMEHDYYQPCVEPTESPTFISNTRYSSEGSCDLKPSNSTTITMRTNNSRPQALYGRKSLMKTVSSNTTTARERKLLKELKKRRDIIRNLKKRLNKIDKISSPLIKSIIETTVENQKRKAHGKRWTDLHKSIALALYNISPKAYAFLREILPMPCVRTLKNALQNMKIEPSIDPSITHSNKGKLNQSIENKSNVISETGIFNITIENMATFEDLLGM